jgi:BirA family biotin operon repressor/biotin-[acetyl-CoA-carboxylase] ligase
MDQPTLISTLADLHLPDIRYVQRIDSTSDEARRWIAISAPDKALVVADEQTTGRGRFQRRWYTPPGAALAFSLVLLSPPFDPHNLSRLTGLGAVAVRNALLKLYALPSQIKWPNDILIGESKAAGVLVEALWSGQILKAVIIGIGINIASESVSAVNLPPPELNYPATCVENALQHPVDRLELLHAVLYELIDTWLPQLSLTGFIQEWEANLAFRDQWVELSSGVADKNLNGKVIGLTQDGSLQLITRAGKLVTIEVGEIHLRPTSADEPYQL